MKPLSIIKGMKKAQLLDYIVSELHPQLIKLHMDNKRFTTAFSSIVDTIRDSITESKAEPQPQEQE